MAILTYDLRMKAWIYKSIVGFVLFCAVYFLIGGLSLQRVEATSTAGRIAFSSNLDNTSTGNGFADIYTIKADGTDRKRLTFTQNNDEESPVVSRDGKKIAYTQSHSTSGGSFFYDIYTMNLDGTNVARLTDGSFSGDDCESPSWSSDGSKIVFQKSYGLNNEIFTMNADGSNQFNLTQVYGLRATDPAWSPLGDKIAFVGKDLVIPEYVAGSWPKNVPNREIYTIKPDGSGLTNLTNNRYSTNVSYTPNDTAPAWSPDGSEIVYSTIMDVYPYVEDIVTMPVSGGSLFRSNYLNNTPQVQENWPAWSPDGTSITYSTLANGPAEVFTMDKTGSNVINISKTATNMAVYESFPFWYTPAATTVNHAPTADFRYNSPEPLGVGFTSLSTDPDGDSLVFVWDFGDKSATLSTADSFAIHRYNKKGTYKVTLTAIDPSGAKGSVTKSVIVK